MSLVLHRNLLEAPPRAGTGTSDHIKEITDWKDNRAVANVFDMSSGAGVSSFGHSNRRVIDAMKMQLDRLPYVHAAQWTTDVVEDAAASLISRAGSRFTSGGVAFFSGGAEAIEAACKIAMQIAVARDGEDVVCQFISRKLSYHGGTQFTLALGDHPRKHISKYSQSSSGGGYHFDANAAHLGDHHSEKESLASLEEMLMETSANGDVPVVVLETIGGTAAHISPPTFAYLAKVRELIDGHRGIMIADEILCGNYRTGHFMAWQYYQQAGENKECIDITPDVVVLGKGITGGYFPMSAVMINSRMRATLAAGRDQKLWATSTNQNHPVGCAAIVAAMMQYSEHLSAQHNTARSILRALPDIMNNSHVSSAQGVGALWGISFAQNEQGLYAKVRHALREKHIACYADGGTIKGRGNMILLAPPYGTSAHQIEEAGRIIGSLKL